MAKRLTVYGIFHNSCADQLINRSSVLSRIPLTASDESDITRKQNNNCWFCGKPIDKKED